MATDQAMTLRLAPEVHQAIVAAAKGRSLSAAALVAEIVTSWAAKNGLLAADKNRRLTAQRKLLTWVEELVGRRREADDWDKHITRDIFAEIAQQKFELYSAAVAGGQKTQLNREIGALVRRGLGAVVREVKGHRLYGQLPRGEDALIRTYTYLFRPSDS